MPILFWGMAPGPGGRQRRDRQAAEMTPLTAIRIGELALAAGIPEGVFQVLPGKGSVVGQRLVDHPAVGKIVFHRLHRGRPGDHGRLRPPGKAGHPGTRRQERQHRLRRCRPGTGRGHRPAGPPSTTPARTAAPGRGSWCSARSWRPSWSCSSPRSRPSRSATRVRGDRDGAADLGRAPGPRRVLRAGRRAGRVPRHRSRRAGALVPADGASAGPAGRPGLHRGGFRARGHRYPFEDEAMAVALANDTPYGLSGSIWTRDVGRAIRVARRWRPAPVGELALLGPLLDPVRRVQAVRPRP